MEIYLIGLLISFVLSSIIIFIEARRISKLTLEMVLRTIFLTILSWGGVLIEIVWIIADIAIKTENIILWSRDKSRINRRTEKDS